MGFGNGSPSLTLKEPGFGHVSSSLIPKEPRLGLLPGVRASTLKPNMFRLPRLSLIHKIDLICIILSKIQLKILQI